MPGVSCCRWRLIDLWGTKDLHGQVSAASIREIKSEPAYSAALSLMFRGVIIVTFALLAALLGIAVVAALHDTAVRAFAQWTLLGFLFVYCVLSRHAVEQNWKRSKESCNHLSWSFAASVWCSRWVCKQVLMQAHQVSSSGELWTNE